ncbi:MAG: hypothetical protein S4CHLAM6_13810 [Chlamydiae bacterium]|nr:hypothetical protein [Chlamydiota bacterium]
MIDNGREYGPPPYQAILLHGGPGAYGEMQPVAQHLSDEFSLLEPRQTKTSINGLVEELKDLIQDKTTPPVTLVGWSWGAWLGFIFAAKHPTLVKKLVLVSSGPFEDSYAEQIMQTRMSRLSEMERKGLNLFFKQLQNSSDESPIFTYQDVEQIFSKSDQYDPFLNTSDNIEVTSNLHFQKISEEAFQLRKEGLLLKLSSDIQCPVTVIHGDYDPHPFEGVKKPLQERLQDVSFILLENCGHKPWHEKQARDIFFTALREELR